MTFRDDREILKQRARDLEHSLAEAERELERRRDAEKRAADLEVELADAQRLLRRSEIVPARPSPDSSRAAGVSIALVLGFSAMAGVFVVRGSPRPTYIPAPIVRVPPHPANDKPAGDLPESEAPSFERPMPLKAALADQPHSVTARFYGSVRGATGVLLPNGTPCEVRSVLRANEQHEVSVRCGSLELYNSTDLLEGVSHLSVEAREYPGNAGTSQASLAWHDVGSRIGLRTEASIDTQGRVAAVWRDTAPSFRVEVDVQERSASYEGTFLRASPANDR